jgi:DNA-binding IclR family transcriptional regulator
MGPDRTSGSAPAVTRAVHILGLLADTPTQVRTLTEISRELGVVKSSVSNLCVALEEGGLIRRTGGGYLLGRRTVELGGPFLTGFDRSESSTGFANIPRCCGASSSRSPCSTAPVCSTSPCMKDGNDSRSPLTSVTAIPHPRPRSAPPYVSELSPAQVAQLYWDPSQLVGFTERSTTTLTQLQAKLERTRERGYATDEGEVHPTVFGLAVLVPGHGSGEPSFGLGVSIVHPTGTRHRPPSTPRRRAKAHPPTTADWVARIHRHRRHAERCAVIKHPAPFPDMPRQTGRPL